MISTGPAARADTSSDLSAQAVGAPVNAGPTATPATDAVERMELAPIDRACGAQPQCALGLRLALAGGGTGGHLVPGLHVLTHARDERARLVRPLEDLVWFTSGRAIEERVLAGFTACDDVNFERVVLALEPDGGGAPSRAALALRTPSAVWRARAALLRHRSDVLVGLGGFTSLPAVIAARSLGIPVALLEINAASGQATRWLARSAARVLHAWPSTFEAARARAGANAAAHRLIGPPLAPSFARLPSIAEACEARSQLGFDAARPLLVVLGGSQGSSALNQFMRAHAPALVAHGLSVLHQTGPGKRDEACPAFSGYRAVEYVDPVATALCAATLVLCRGGASTLAEVAALRRPAIVVPYPHHADRHQERNARELGAGVRIVGDAELTTSLRREIASLASADGASERERMSAALARVVPLDAAARLYGELCAIARRVAPAPLDASAPQRRATHASQRVAFARDEPHDP